VLLNLYKTSIQKTPLEKDTAGERRKEKQKIEGKHVLIKIIGLQSGSKVGLKLQCNRRDICPMGVACYTWPNNYNLQLILL
jgi:hypothetical protein